MALSTPGRVLAPAASCLALIGVTACQDLGNPLEPEIEPEPALAEVSGSLSSADGFRVYTQNVYLGGDTGPLFNGLDFSDIVAVLEATNRFWGEVQDSDAQARVREIVDEIGRRRPHVVSLQEVLLFATIDATTGQITGGLDILALFEAELAARRLPYSVEVVQQATQSALPLSFDFGTLQPLEVLSFTDRIALLRHESVELVDRAQGQYDATFQLGPVTLARGWGRVSVAHDGTAYHVVGTHLEVQSLLSTHSLQADELRQEVVASLAGVTIIAGDLNSDAAAQPGAPSWTPTYDDLVAAGFIDGWAAAAANRDGPGFTCCQDPSLRESGQLFERIDFVLVRPYEPASEGDGGGGGAAASGHGIFRAEVVGEEEHDRTDRGLWPSDHAGLFTSVLFPTS